MIGEAIVTSIFLARVNTSGAGASRV